MKITLPIILPALSLVLLGACVQQPKQPAPNRYPMDHSGELVAYDTSAYKPSREWNNYWYAGKAEITSYQLQQSRYGEIHEGNLTNIFVTEDFSASKQVKPDEPEQTGDRVKVLKLNQAVKFVTGIYPYSMMLSTFSPVDINAYPHAVKITASSQEWCGQSFFQLNNRNNQFLVEQRSYFEKEGDQDVVLAPLLLEDELWTRARMNPKLLPQGNLQILPGALFLRLSHLPIASISATAVLKDSAAQYTYQINWPSINRQLEVHIEKKFPFQIIGWQDRYPGTDSESLTTTAIRKKTLIVDYWTKHAQADRRWRDSLQLPKDFQ